MCKEGESLGVGSQRSRKGYMGTDICQEEGLSFHGNRKKGDYGNQWGCIGQYVDVVLVTLHD